MDDTVELRGDGLGAVDFGEDAETVLQKLGDFVGPPEFDPGWEDASDNFCNGTVVRFPEWEGFFIILTDSATPYASAGTRHFAFWAAFDDQLSSPSGLAPSASSLADLTSTVGPVTPVYEVLFDLYLVDVTSGPDAGIQYELLDPEETELPIVGMSAGARDICGE